MNQTDTLAKLNRHIDNLILAETRIAFGNARDEEEWMRWHSDAEFETEMVAAGERKLAEVSA